jgi:hypothetical protein
MERLQRDGAAEPRQRSPLSSWKSSMKSSSFCRGSYDSSGLILRLSAGVYGWAEIGQGDFTSCCDKSRQDGIAAGPHLLPSSQGKVTLMVSPLLSLHDEQVCLSFFFSFFFGGISRLTCICRLLRSRTNLGSRPLRLTAPMAGVQRISCR